MLKNRLPSAIRGLLYLTVISPLLFTADYFYPFIVPRTVFFRLTVALAVLGVLWLLARGQLAINKAITRKQLFLTLALGVFVLVNVMASFFGLAPFFSWYGDIERSWGLFTLLHVFVFYLLARTFFTEQHWRIFWRAAIGSSVLVALYGIVQHYALVLGINMIDAGVGRIPSTLGNPAYTAMALIFGMVFTAQTWPQNNRKRGYFYGFLFAIQLLAFSLTGIRGAYLGALAGLALFFLIYGFTATRKKIKYLSLAVLGSLLLCGALVFIYRQESFVGSLPIVGRLATISAADSTAATRLIGWRAALSGFKEAPVLGVGLENFGYVFNKYFDPQYYSYAASEPYFDRAHNNVLDILVTSGLLGLAAYLAIFLCAFYCLWRGYQDKKFSRRETALWSALLLAYTVHMFFVFDDLSALLYLIATLAFIEWRRHQSLFASNARGAGRWPGLKYVLLICLAGAVIYWGVRPNLAIAVSSKKIIQAVVLQSRGQYQEAGEEFIAALAKAGSLPRKTMLNPYLDYFNFIANYYAKNPNAETKALLDKHAAALLEIINSEIHKNPFDPVLYNKAANIYTTRYAVNRDKNDAETALLFLDEAIKLGPNRPQYYNLLAETYVLFGQPDEAIMAAEKSLAMNRDYRETYKYLVNAYMAATIKALRAGNSEDAIKYAAKAAEYDPTLAEEVEYIKNEINAGRHAALLKKLTE